MYREGWKLFVPHMQTYEPIARMHMSLVRQNDVSAACNELDTKQAVGTARIFNDPLALAQTTVERAHHSAYPRTVEVSRFLVEGKGGAGTLRRNAMANFAIL